MNNNCSFCEFITVFGDYYRQIIKIIDKKKINVFIVLLSVLVYRYQYIHSNKKGNVTVPQMSQSLKCHSPSNVTVISSSPRYKQGTQTKVSSQNHFFVISLSLKLLCVPWRHSFVTRDSQNHKPNLKKRMFQEQWALP